MTLFGGLLSYFQQRSVHWAGRVHLKLQVSVLAQRANLCRSQLTALSGSISTDSFSRKLLDPFSTSFLSFSCGALLIAQLKNILHPSWHFSHSHVRFLYMPDFPTAVNFSKTGAMEYSFLDFLQHPVEGSGKMEINAASVCWVNG